MEILENSIIKLIVRQGSDVDRKNIILDSGELGYTTDTERLFIGNAVQQGGKLTGNIFKGSAPSITDASLRPVEIGDLAFETDSSKLYRLKNSTGANVTDWEHIGSIYSASSGILISSDNKISLPPLSAGQISSDTVKYPIIVDNTGKITLSSTQILLKYDISTPSKCFSVNVASYSTLSTGHYKVIFSNPLPSINYIPFTQILGMESIDCQARVINPTISSCDIRVADSYGVYKNANVILTVTY